LARDGERATGEYLDRLCAKGCPIVHDIVGDGFNIDHVLLATAVIFTIEAKTRSKLIKGNAVVSDDGTQILVNGYEVGGVLIQAKAQAQWTHELPP